jgi:flagellar biosynthesis/type III secretory pathway protein FliH
VSDSVTPPSHDDPPIGQNAARLEAAIHAAMAGSMPFPQPASAVPPSGGPTRDYEGELAAKAAEIAGLRDQLAAVVGSVDRARRHLLESCESDVVELATRIAERIVGRELAMDPALVASWTHDALTRLADQPDVVVLVSPDVLAAVPKNAWRDSAGRAFAPTVDPKLPPGSCEVRSTVSRIDGSASARIRAIVEALGTTEER